MSLTKEEIHDFVEEYLDVEYEYQETDDFVVKAWVNFLESHRLNPLEKHEFVFTTPDLEEPWEYTKYNVIWHPTVILGINSFEYKYIHIGVRKKPGAGVPRALAFKPQLGHGFIK